jgi:hypothetical protein
MRPLCLNDKSCDSNVIDCLIMISFWRLFSKSVLDPPVIIWFTPVNGGLVKLSSYFGVVGGLVGLLGKVVGVEAAIFLGIGVVGVVDVVRPSDYSFDVVGVIGVRFDN